MNLNIVLANVMRRHPIVVMEARHGKPQAIGFLVGQMMKETGGKANAAEAQALIRRYITPMKPNG